MARASKPNVPTKQTEDLHYASEVNAVDTAIDAVIDDYVSQTDTTNQNVVSNLIFGAGKGPDALGTKKINEAAIGDGKIPVYRTATGELGYESVAGGGGAPDSATYVTINDESGSLPNSDQHKDLTGANLHAPATHTHLEADITDLDHDAAKIQTKVVDLAGIQTDYFLKYDGTKFITAAGSAVSAKGSFTYLVYKSVSTYYVIDEDGNSVGTPGSVARVQIKWALDNAANGLVFIKKGDYEIDTQILVPANSKCRGEGITSRLYLEASRPATEADNRIFRFQYVSNIQISDLYLDGNDDNQTADNGALISGDRGSNWYIENVWFRHHKRFGIWFDTTGSPTANLTDWHVHNCHFEDFGEDCIDYMNENNTYFLMSTSVTDCDFKNFEQIAIGITTTSAHDDYCPWNILCIVADNTIFEETTYGISTARAIQLNAFSCVVDSNVIWGCKTGISIQYSTSDNNLIIGNHIMFNDTNHTTCILFGSNAIGDDHTPQYNYVIDNVFRAPPTAGLALDMLCLSAAKYTLFRGNIFRKPAGNGNNIYVFHIRETGGGAVESEYNTFIDNDVKDFRPYLFRTSGDAWGMQESPHPNDIFNTFTVPFVQGSTFLSADGNSWGWEIDLATEYAVAFTHLSHRVAQVVRIKIHAVALVTEGDAMRLQINGYAGTSNETEGTEPIVVADHPSTTTNFTAQDYIHWVITPDDDADISDIQGGDTVQIKVQHEAAGNGDCETDAVFHAIEIEYV